MTMSVFWPESMKQARNQEEEKTKFSADSVKIKTWRLQEDSESNRV